MPSSPDNRDLLVVVRAWAQSNYPGCPVEYVSIHLRFLPVAIRLADAPANGSASAQEARSADEAASDPYGREHASACIADVLEVLEKARRPMTTMRLMAALERAGKIWSKRTLDTYLAEMVKDGTLTQGRKPPGYRLPEWDEGTSQ